MVYEFKNPHPDNKSVGDCVVRAFTITQEKDYLEVRRELNRLNREWNLDGYKKRKFLKKYYKEKGYERISINEQGMPKLRGYEVAELYPKGTYILNMRKHLVAMIDGIIYDTWNSSNKVVYNIYKYKGW